MAASSSRRASGPGLPGGRLAFERAIRQSSLPPPARHVALTIATWADVGTGLIPERFQPSLSTIAEATGMGATTVKKHLTVLETEGWLLRDRPEIARARTEHARTQYALTVPTPARGHGPEAAMPRSGDDHAMGQSGPSHGRETTKAWSAAGHKSSLNPDESPGSTPSSPAGPSPDDSAASADATEEGEGGGSDLRSMAVHIAASLDYQGQTPDRRQRKTIEDRLVAALEDGWTLDGLAVYLHLGNYRPDSVAAFYMAKLHPDRLPPAVPLPAPRAAGGIRGDLPDAAAIQSLTLEDVFGPARRDTADGGLWERAAVRARQRMAGTGARGGTDDTVAGWGQVARELAAMEPHRPYSDDHWRTPADPVEAAAIPWCGELECDPVTRTRDHDEPGGLKSSARCPKCHPKKRQ